MSTITLFPRRTWPSRLGHAAAALLLTAFVIGVPIALCLGGSPFPAHSPHFSAAWRDLRAGYVPAVVLANVALLAGWCVWAFLSFEIVTEARSVLHSHTSRRSAALGPLQPLIAKLVTAAVLSLPLTAVRPMLRPAIASTAILSAARPTIRTTAPASTTVTAAAHTALPTYTVRRGDTLWGIAARYLGDPLRWKEITALNTDRREGTSEFTDPHWIYPGWTLVLPADARGLAESPAVSPQQATPPSSVTRQGAATHGAAQTPVQPKRSVTPVSPAGNGTTRSHPPQGVALPRQPAPRSSPSAQNQQSNDRHSGKDLPQHPNRAPIAPVGFGILAVGLLGLLAGCAAPRNDTAGRGVASSFRRELQQTSSVPSSPMSIDRWQPLSTVLVDCSVRFCTAPTARRSSSEQSSLATRSTISSTGPHPRPRRSRTVLQIAGAWNAPIPRPKACSIPSAICPPCSLVSSPSEVTTTAS